MTPHARQRLKERYNMSFTEFYKVYTKAVKEKQFFPIHQKPFYQEQHHSVIIILKIGNNKIIPLSISKRDGAIITVLQTSDYYMDKARERGFII